MEAKESGETFERFAENFGLSGFVADTVPAAILLAIESLDFLHSIQKLIEIGGDTDTIGSIYGQIFGAAYGKEFLPMEYCERVTQWKMIEQIVASFSRSIDQ